MTTGTWQPTQHVLSPLLPCHLTCSHSQGLTAMPSKLLLLMPYRQRVGQPGFHSSGPPSLTSCRLDQPKPWLLNSSPGRLLMSFGKCTSMPERPNSGLSKQPWGLSGMLMCSQVETLTCACLPSVSLQFKCMTCQQQICMDQSLMSKPSVAVTTQHGMCITLTLR